MLSLKGQVVTKSAVAGDTDYERQLEYLYARKSTIDALIESLEDYERFRETRATSGVLKTA